MNTPNKFFRLLEMIRRFWIEFLIPYILVPLWRFAESLLRCIWKLANEYLSQQRRLRHTRNTAQHHRMRLQQRRYESKTP